MRKIGIEAQRLFRNKKHGMDIVVLELIKNLQKIDKENEYFVFVKSDKDKCIESTDNFKVIELDAPTYPYWEQWSLVQNAKKYGCEILHCTSNTAPVKSNIPLIVTVHDIIYLEQRKTLQNGGSLYQRFGNMYRQWNVPKVMRKADAVVTVSDFEKDNISRRFPEYSDKIHSIYNGVSAHFKQITDKVMLNQIAKKYKLPEDFIFYFGNTAPKKNTPNVLKAYSFYRKSATHPLPLVMVDFGIDNLKKILKENETPNLIDNIHITDYVHNADLPVIYTLSNLFLYPSLRESFGIPMLEAMQCGTPVISSNSSSMPEVADDAAYLVDPNDPKEICDGMHQILENDAIRNKLIERGFKRASQFSWEKMAKQVKEIYDQKLELTPTSN